MYGIPNMKLDKGRSSLRRIELMEKEGIKFVCNANVGENVEPQLLLKDFDATVICTGATHRATCRSKAASSRACNSRWNSSPPTPRRVLDSSTRRRSSAPRARTSSSSAAATPAPTASALPCARAARACMQIEIMPKPPMDRAADNPWPEWPKVYKMDYGQEEAAAKFGADPRVYLTTVKNSKATSTATQGVVTVNIKWEKNDKGQFVPDRTCRAPRKNIPRSSCCWPWASSGPEQALLKDLKVEARPAQQREGRARQVRDQHPRRVRRRRLPPRTEPGRLGHQRRSRCRPRVRPLPHGRDRTTVEMVRPCRPGTDFTAPSFPACRASIPSVGRTRLAGVMAARAPVFRAA